MEWDKNVKEFFFSISGRVEVNASLHHWVKQRKNYRLDQVTDRSR